MFIPDIGSGFFFLPRILDQGVKKTPDPGSGSAEVLLCVVLTDLTLRSFLYTTTEIYVLFNIHSRDVVHFISFILKEAECAITRKAVTRERAIPTGGGGGRP